MADTGEQAWQELGQRIGREVGRWYSEQFGGTDAIARQVSIGPDIARKIVHDSGVLDLIREQLGLTEPYVPKGLRHGLNVPAPVDPLDLSR